MAYQNTVGISRLASGVTLDAIAGANATAGAVDMNSNQFSNLAAASSAGQAVEYSQFEAALDGRSWKDPVRVATAAALPAYTRTTNTITADANGALPSIDGVSLAVNDRLILQDGAAGADNGIYEVTSLGDGSNPFVLDRTDDADTAAELDDGATAWVQEGTANGDKILTQTATVSTINSDSVSWAQTGSATSVSVWSDLSDVDDSARVDGSLARFDTTGSTWQATTGSNLLLSDAGQLQIPTTGSGAGVLIGGDFQIYRSAADEGTTPDDFVVGGILTTNGRAMDVASTKTANYSATAADEMIPVDTTGGVVTITFPSGAKTGQQWEVKDVGFDAENFNITLASAGAENFLGIASGATFTMNQNGDAFKVTFDGTDFIVS